MSKTNLHDTISLQLSPHKTTSRLPGEIMEGWWYVFPPLIVFIIVFVLYGRSKMKKIKEKDDSYRDKT
jgi:Na+/H+ antiporter NhaC